METSGHVGTLGNPGTVEEMTGRELLELFPGSTIERRLSDQYPRGKPPPSQALDDGERFATEWLLVHTKPSQKGEPQPREEQ